MVSFYFQQRLRSHTSTGSVASKRSKKAKGDTKCDAKRVKVVDDGDRYEVVLCGDTYIDVDQLFKFPALKAYFAKRYKRSVKRLIEEEELQVIYVPKKNVERGELHMKTSYAPKSDARLVRKNADIEHPFAPPVITDDDLEFFVDRAGVHYQVEMRGTRTMEGIYFKAKDVGRVFASDRLVDTILDEHKSYRESTDFVWFALLIATKRRD